ncbi:hypothetical protein NEILACOT_04797 [Neisseria lactamica ATCC 23970]|uniref:Uncharacterized protein n=1 Tax=Neisseria lactamica ATCC 23970 TaxID=546265 RepID=D0WB72_NEILA|nr:hypothetical protein NEILACOT_04797 [Neisseria lactamica ATCC 23970]
MSAHANGRVGENEMPSETECCFRRHFSVAAKRKNRPGNRC